MVQIMLIVKEGVGSLIHGVIVVNFIVNGPLVNK